MPQILQRPARASSQAYLINLSYSFLASISILFLSPFLRFSLYLYETILIFNCRQRYLRLKAQYSKVTNNLPNILQSGMANNILFSTVNSRKAYERSIQIGQVPFPLLYIRLKILYTCFYQLLTFIMRSLFILSLTTLLFAYK